MSVTIELNPIEEARLASASRQTGLTPEQWLKQLMRDHWPEDTTYSTNGIQNGHEKAETTMSANESALALFAKWAEEDAKMTDEERMAEDRLWEDLEKALMGNGSLNCVHSA